MNEETFNMSMRKFLKKVGVTSQHEIEKAVYEGMDAGQIRGTGTIQARVILEVSDLGLRHEIDGEITLE